MKVNHSEKVVGIEDHKICHLHNVAKARKMIEKNKPQM